jgi:hypothetical protein
MAVKTKTAVRLRLALIDGDVKALKRLMYLVLEEVEVFKRSYRIHCPTDPNHGRLISEEGEDITDRIFADETAARAFLRRLR